MVIPALSQYMSRIFGSRNDRLIKAYRRRVEQINALEPEMLTLTDEQIRDRVAEIQRQLAEEQQSAGQLQPLIMALAREAMDRAIGMRSIFNPDAGFDPAVLPAELQPVYVRLREEAESLPPAPVRGGEPAPGYLQIQVPNDLYDAVRALYPESRPPFRCRPFDVQLIGGMVLGEGKIAEMRTGEGKTIVAPLACFVAALEGLSCHVVTVNDYLVQRDRDWVFPFFHSVGLTVGAIHPHHMQPPHLKAEAYQSHVVYGTNSEFGFDYLRDNMKLTAQEQVQKRRDFCIIDEVDSILIDEARTPLIISGPAHQDTPRYPIANQIAVHLIQCQKQWDAADQKVQRVQLRIKGLEGDIRNTSDKAKIAAMREEIRQLEKQLPALEAERDQFVQYYEVEHDKKAAHLTHDGVAEAQKKAGIGSFYVGNNMDFPHLLENALRAHVIYQRDKDYVVQNGEVVIVDEFTGRLMIGRQWSDGLHQAIETKENVQIKEETQTLATVTIQNFFKLYKRLGGMTGTAITEATEFGEIYKLDVVAIPTNRAIARIDRDDLIFLSAQDKWEAILDEIKRVHDLGRPVLVGTTSVEKSEMLSQALTKKYGIQHAVLNAKQHEREAQVVENAGALGAVMIATNMAGRGTDIKLQRIDRETLVRHWQTRNLLPRQVGLSLSDEEILSLAWRHQCHTLLQMPAKEAMELSDEAAYEKLVRHWVQRDAWAPQDKAQKMNAEECVAQLDRLPDYQKHRLQLWDHVEKMGGLHIIGTERHESRRIDNQLRGRAGRQGDRGSSRFFIALEDDLMKLFMPKAMMGAMAKLGLKEGEAIEHRWVTKSVQRAQRKVEERNYESRKMLLEYDEVMEHQRNYFYGVRQAVLEGEGVRDLILDYLEEAAREAVALYKGRDYVQNQVAEWCRAELDVSIEPGKIHTDDFEELQNTVRRAAMTEVEQVVSVTLGEYMSNDMLPEEWDLKGLEQWARSRFEVSLRTESLQNMNVDQVEALLIEAACQQIEKRDLAGLARFTEQHYAEKQLVEWVTQKFGVQLDAAELAALNLEEATGKVLEAARAAYRRREIEYPVQFIMDVVMQGAQQDSAWAVEQLLQVANTRYALDWTREQVVGMSGQEIYDQLVAAAQTLLEEGRLTELCQQQAREYGQDATAHQKWLMDQYAYGVTEEQVREAGDVAAFLEEKARESLRVELARLERFVLLQILDSSWKDHLYAMDQLKDSIGLRGYAEKDPRIEYKREGSAHFQQMLSTVRDKVTELIFRARLTPQVQLRSAYGDQQQAAQAAPPPTALAAAAAEAMATAGTAEQQRDLEAAERAGAEGEDLAQLSRKQRRAAEARQRQETRPSARPIKKRKR